jgi:hypothetical protein
VAFIIPFHRQYSTGGKAKLLGTSKRGNVYLRKVLIHGAELPCCGSSEIERPSTLAESIGRQGSQERRRGCDGEQAGTHRMGRTIEQRRL